MFGRVASGLEKIVGIPVWLLQTLLGKKRQQQPNFGSPTGRSQQLQSGTAEMPPEWGLPYGSGIQAQAPVYMNSFSPNPQVLTPPQNLK